MFISTNLMNRRKLARKIVTHAITPEQRLSIFAQQIDIDNIIETRLDDIMHNNLSFDFELHVNKHGCVLDANTSRYKIDTAHQNIFSYDDDDNNIFIKLDKYFNVDDVFSDNIDDNTNTIQTFLRNNDIYFVFVLYTYHDCIDVCKTMITPILDAFNNDIEFIKSSVIDIVMSVPFDKMQHNIVLSKGISKNHIDTYVRDKINDIHITDNVNNDYIYIDNENTLLLLRSALYDVLQRYTKEHDNVY